MTPYAGIGSRNTPPDILRLMTRIARGRASSGLWLLRSGGAIGADMAFESGVITSDHPEARDIYTPQSDIPTWAFDCAREFHPNWPAVSSKGPYVERLMARNSLIILGASGHDPVHHIICWTAGGVVTGGTGQALRIALHHNIPIHNLGHHQQRLLLESTLLTPTPEAAHETP